jgi:hypothetical protein
VRVASHSSWLQARLNAAHWLSAAPRGINITLPPVAAPLEHARVSGPSAGIDVPVKAGILLIGAVVGSNPYRRGTEPPTNGRFCEHRGTLMGCWSGAALTLPSRPIWALRWRGGRRQIGPTGAAWGRFHNHRGDEADLDLAAEPIPCRECVQCCR